VTDDPIARIFQTDPAVLADEQAAATAIGNPGPIDIIIARYREARGSFAASGKAPAKAAKPKAEKVEALNLDELF
jgi:hypothetical protein